MTGVQTCALPILGDGAPPQNAGHAGAEDQPFGWSPVPLIAAAVIILLVIGGIGTWRLGLFGGDDGRTPSVAAGGSDPARTPSPSDAKDEEPDRDAPTPAENEEEPDRDAPTPAESNGSGSGRSGPGAGAADRVAPCARAPQFAVRSVSYQNGELEVTTEVTPSCAKGDVLTGAANGIMLYASSSTSS